MASPVYACADRGRNFARYALSLLKSPNDLPSALGYACAQYGPSSAVATVLRSAVGAGTTTDATWAGSFVEYQTLQSEFLSLVQPKSILGKMTLRNVPLNTRVLRELDAGMTAYWVGEGLPAPVTSGAFDTVTLGLTRVAGIAVETKEVRDLSGPKAEPIILKRLVAAAVKMQDETFIGNGAGIAGIKPAGVLAGITPMASSGDPATDFGLLFDEFGGDEDTATLVMRPGTARRLALSGSNVFADVGARGGTILGVPTIVSKYVGDGSSSPTSDDIILIDGEQVLLGAADFVIESGTSATLEMLDNPVGNSAIATATSLVSMFQSDSVALRVDRYVNWVVARSDAVAWIQGADYTSA